MRRMYFNYSVYAEYEHTDNVDDLRKVFNDKLSNLIDDINALPGVVAYSDHFYGTYGNDNDAKCVVKVYVEKAGRKASWHDVMHIVNGYHPTMYRYDNIAESEARVC